MQLPNWATNLLKPGKTTSTTQVGQTDTESMKEIIDLAALFDDVIKRPGYIKILEFMAGQVNTEIVKATEKPYEPEAQRVHVIRWDAKRELLDAVIGYVRDVQKSKEDIVAQFRKSKDEMVDVT